MCKQGPPSHRACRILTSGLLCGLSALFFVPLIAAPRDKPEGASGFKCLKKETQSLSAADLGVGGAFPLPAANVLVAMNDAPSHKATLGAAIEGATNQLTRRIDDLWEWRLSVDASGATPSVAIEYAVYGENGEIGVFSNPEDPSSMIDVTLQPLGLRMEKTGKESWLLSESVDLTMDFEQVRRAGKHNGRIQVTVISQNF